MDNSLLIHVSQRLATIDVQLSIEGNGLHVKHMSVDTRISVEERFREAYRNYKQLTGAYFDSRSLSYHRSTEVDFPLVRLDSNFFKDEDVSFQSANGDQVAIKKASMEYMFAYFDSDAYPRYFKNVISNRLSRQVSFTRSLQTLFPVPLLATYSTLLAVPSAVLAQKAHEHVRACLVKLAVEKQDCYELAKPVGEQIWSKLDEPREMDDSIPRASYDENLASYYKVGRAASFPSQAFLCFYQVLEYYFLRVAEDSLHQRLRTLLNQTSFRATTDGIDKAISLVRRHDSSDDETEMLKRVLHRFVEEAEFIHFVLRLQERAGERIYTKRTKVFGEDFEIALKEGHALGNVAKLLKHVRNAIVHSSDRYNREECHIPLSSSENLISTYIPLIRFFAEKVLFATAEPLI